jgi:hypothetical protein
MSHWLFTEGRELLGGLLLPLLCCTPMLTLLTAVMLGAGIRRVSDEGAKPSWIQRLGLAVTYVCAMLMVMTAYLVLLGDQAVKRGRSDVSEVLAWIVGAPRGVNAMRLFLFGILLAFILLMTAVGVHSLLRNGGWLREKIDRLRAPMVKRGALGSSHFCTPREYRRFRRPDPQGLTLLSAFWGENRRRLDMGSGQFCLSGEDVARGILTLGGPGSGKTQCEITGHILKYAAVTRHLVVS